jgi:colicin import membrane protein
MIAAGAAAVVASPSTAQAQYGGGYGTTGPNTQLIEAKRQIQAAEKEVTRIRKDMTNMKTKVQSKYETKDDWEAAKKNLKDAEAANTAARKRVMAKLLTNPAYKAAADKKAKADQQVAALQAQSAKADLKQLTAAQQAQTDSGLTLRKLESDAMDSDPKVAEAKEKLADAKKQWDALQDEVKQALEQDPEYQQAETELQTAQANVTQMKQQLAMQSAQEAAARRQAAESARQSRRGSSGGGRRGGGY